MLGRTSDLARRSKIAASDLVIDSDSDEDADTREQKKSLGAQSANASKKMMMYHFCMKSQCVASATNVTILRRFD